LNDEDFTGGTVRIENPYKKSKQTKQELFDEKSKLGATLILSFSCYYLFYPARF
jgi:hypothetical protein